MVMAEDVAHAWNDVTGEELDAGMVKGARMEEIGEVHRHKVYYKVPIQESWDVTGKAPIKTRWLDINKGDKVHPNYRSRFVAKGLQQREETRSIRSDAAHRAPETPRLQSCEQPARE